MTTATPSTISARLERLERLVINLSSALHLHTEIIMSTAQELQTALDALTARATEAKADADRHAAAKKAAAAAPKTTCTAPSVGSSPTADNS
jgi:peptidoglycan hydrolase CwlO-like protein